MSKEDSYNTIFKFQKNEITEYMFYTKLSKFVDKENAEVLRHIGEDELKHYNEWKKHTNKEVTPDKWKIFWHLFIYRIFGLTFSVKMMENGEKEAEILYEKVIEDIPEAELILKDEIKHEKMLVNMINEERINYIGSMVLGLSDALVELTGALSGLSFALQNTKMVGIAGLITGISASLSMAASEYLSQKSEKNDTNPLKASVYTGIAYVFTVLFLIFPYFVFQNYQIALGFTLIDAILIVLLFSFFVSVVKELSFRRIFLEMFTLSFGVALISFFIGILIRSVFKIEI